MVSIKYAVLFAIALSSALAVGIAVRSFDGDVTGSQS